MKIAIFGTGNMGEWLARILSAKHFIAVYDVDPERLKPLLDVPGIRIVRNLDDLKEFNPHLFINAVSLQHTVKVFREVESYLSKDCLLCDIASVKGEIPDYYREDGRRFISVHPMFGPTFSNLESLKEENAVIINESDEEGKEFFRKFFKSLNLTVFEYTFREHDEMMAYSLSLPFAATLVFAACMSDQAVPGSTFAKHKKIARGLLSEDDRLLSEILFNQFTIVQLEKVTARLEFLKHVIRAKDYEEADRFYDKLRENIG